MNIEENAVTQNGGWLGASPVTRELVGDRAPVDGDVVRAAGPPALLQQEVHEHVDDDERDRDERRAVRRDVVLEREHARSLARRLPGR